MTRGADRPVPRRPSGLLQFLAVLRKEVLQTVRDKRIMAMLVIAPLLQTIVFGYAVNFDVDRVPTVVVDADRSSDSRKHKQRLLADGTLLLAGEAHDMPAAEAALDSWQAAAIVALRPGFESELLAHRSAEVQVVLDGTDPNRAAVAAAAASRYFGEMAEALVEQQARERGMVRPPEVKVIPRVAYNPSLRTPPYMIPGVMAMLLVIVTTIVTAMGMARERETGTLEQVLVTPIRPLYLLLGKIAPFVFIGLLDVALVLTAGIYIFDLPLRGKLLVLLSGTLLYLLSTLGVGLFIATVSSTQQQSFLGGFLFAMPAILLSGVMTPIRAMPDWLAAITYLNPVRYYVEVLRAVLLKGAGHQELAFELGALATFGVAIVVISTLRFRKRLQ